MLPGTLTGVLLQVLIFPTCLMQRSSLPALQSISFEDNKYYSVSYRNSRCSVHLGTKLLRVSSWGSVPSVVPGLLQESKSLPTGKWLLQPLPHHSMGEGLPAEETAKAGTPKEFASVLQSRIFSILPSAPLHLSYTSFLALQHAPHLPQFSFHIAHLFVYLSPARKSWGNNLAFTTVLFSASLDGSPPAPRTACFRTATGQELSAALCFDSAVHAQLLLLSYTEQAFYWSWEWISGFGNVIQDSQLFLLFCLLQSVGLPIKDPVCCTVSHTD